MSDRFLIRVGFAGDCFVARMSPLAEGKLVPGGEVLIRTPRGVELGEVITSLDASDALPNDTDCLSILRVIASEDRWLLDRLKANKVDAVRECQLALRESQSEAVLLDVDQLIDGGTLILHFLGTPNAIDQRQLDEIVGRYEATVQSIPLSELIHTGCGPGCGTEEASGRSCEGCSTCAVQSACSTKR